MANSSNYTTYVVGPVQPVNDCERIVLCNSSDFTDIKISIYSLDKYLERVLNSDTRLVLYRNTKDYFEYRKRNITWLSDSDKRNAWGFDIVIFLSTSAAPLGYTKYNSLKGTGNDGLNITIELEYNLESGPDIILDTTLVYVTEADEKEKYRGISAVVEEALSKNPGQSWYSNNLESEDIVFLGPSSVIGEKLRSINFFNNVRLHMGFFDKYSVGYYGGNDIALFCWSYSEVLK